MMSLKNIARELAIKNKNVIGRSSDNQECACEIIFDLLLQRTGKTTGELSEADLENYWDAAYYGYQAIESFLVYLVD